MKVIFVQTPQYHPGQQTGVDEESNFETTSKQSQKTRRNFSWWNEWSDVECQKLGMNKKHRKGNLAFI